MRKLMFGAVAAALVSTAALSTPAAAQSWRGGYAGSEVRREQRECNRELRRAESRREYYRELRECRREIAQARREARRDWRDDRRDWRYGHDRYDRYGYRGW